MPFPTTSPTPTTTIQVGDWTGSINGLDFGVGTSYLIKAVLGWRSTTASPLGGASGGSSSSSLPAPRAQQNGSWFVPYYTATRDVTISIDVIAAVADFGAAVAALEAATQTGTGALIPLSLQVDGVYSTVYGQVTNRDIPTEFAYQFGLTEATITLECADPRRFGLDVSSSTNLPTSSGGITWPITWPIEWDSTQVTGSVLLTNPGNTSGPVKLRIDGPIVAPSVTQVATGLTVATSSDLVVYAGDFLEIDCEARTVLYNGESSRNGWVISRGWFGLEPGLNEFAFKAATYNSSALLTVTGSPAWI